MNGALLPFPVYTFNGVGKENFTAVYGANGAVHGTIRTVNSSSQDHHPSKNSVQKTICCNSTSNAPDDGHMYPKHVELRIHQ